VEIPTPHHQQIPSSTTTNSTSTSQPQTSTSISNTTETTENSETLSSLPSQTPTHMSQQHPQIPQHQLQLQHQLQPNTPSCLASLPILFPTPQLSAQQIHHMLAAQTQAAQVAQAVQLSLQPGVPGQPQLNLSQLSTQPNQQTWIHMADLHPAQREAFVAAQRDFHTGTLARFAQGFFLNPANVETPPPVLPTGRSTTLPTKRSANEVFPPLSPPSKSRRDSHNATEQRRRNKIREKTEELRRLVPDCDNDRKAAILQKSVDYIKRLKSENEKLTEQIRKLQENSAILRGASLQSLNLSSPNSVLTESHSDLSQEKR